MKNDFKLNSVTPLSDTPLVYTLEWPLHFIQTSSFNRKHIKLKKQHGLEMLPDYVSFCLKFIIKF